MAIKWGTDSRIEYIEPTYKFPISIGASGELSLRVEDSRKLLVTLVGTTKDFIHETLTTYFRSVLMTRIKSYIAQAMKSDSINIFKIDERLNQFSNELKENLIPDFSEYGLQIERFFVTSIAKPDGDLQYEKFKELHFREFHDINEAQLRQQLELIEQQTKAQKIIIESHAISEKRKAEGYTFQEEKGFEVAQNVAQNTGVGNFTNAGIGLGMIAGVGQGIGHTVASITSKSMEPVTNCKPGNTPDYKETRFCENCGVLLIEGASFCDECGCQVDTSVPGCCKGCSYVFTKESKFCPKCGLKR